MSADFLNEAELALKAVSSAIDLLGDRPELTFTKGTPRDVVTEIDQRIELHLRDILRGTPYPIVGEEDAATHAAFTAKSPCWFLDPIDGTANFIAGIPFFGSSVGLMSGDEPIVGAVSLPAVKELYFTHGTGGAYFNGRRLSVSDVALEKALVAASFSGDPTQSEFRAKQYRLFGRVNDRSRGCLRTGSAAANLCLTAAGRLGAAYGFEAALWDVAAGLAIAKRAGCRIVVDVNAKTMRANYVAGAPSVVEGVLRLFDEEGLKA